MEKESPPSINMMYESIRDMGGICAASQGDNLKFPSRSPPDFNEAGYLKCCFLHM